MKKIFTILGMLAIAACSKDARIPVKSGVKVPLEFSADGGKTVMNSVNVFWESGDEISILDGTDNERFTTSNSGISAIFKGSAYDSGTYYAVYPYQEGTSLSGGVITASVPDAQIARKGNFGRGANLSVGKASGSRVLAMKNVCGYVKFSIGTSSTYTGISISAIGGEKIAGPFNISIDNNGIPTVSAISEGKSSISFSPSSGTFAKGDYWVALAPGTLSKGLRFVLAGTDGYLYKKDISFYKSTDRNVPYNIGRIDEGLEKIASGLTLDPKTKTRISGGETSASIYIVTNIPTVTAKVKSGATLADASVTKISSDEFKLNFTNPGVDPQDIRKATVVFSADGVPDLEVTVSQCPQLTVNFSTAAFNPALPVKDTRSTNVSEHNLTVGSHTYTFAQRCLSQEAGVSYMLYKGKLDGVLSFFQFPGIAGLTLKSVFISIKAHSSNYSIKAAIRDAEGAYYSDTYLYNTKSTATTHTFNLGDEGKESPQAGVAYRLSSVYDYNCHIDKMILSYE